MMEKFKANMNALAWWAQTKRGKVMLSTLAAGLVVAVDTYANGGNVRNIIIVILRAVLLAFGTGVAE